MLITKILLIGHIALTGKPDIISGWHDLKDCAYAASRYTAPGAYYNALDCVAYYEGARVGVLLRRDLTAITQAPEKNRQPSRNAARGAQKEQKTKMQENRKET